MKNAGNGRTNFVQNYQVLSIRFVTLFRFRGNFYIFPLEPKPPSPLSVSPRLSERIYSAAHTGIITICAILSSNVDIAIQQGVCFSAEVGLSGELRQITRIEQRIAEAEKLGFNTMIIPRNNLKGISTKDFKIKLVEASKVEEAFQYLFG